MARASSGAAAARIRQRRQRGRRAALLALDRLRSAGLWDASWDAALDVLGLGGRGQRLSR